MLSSKEILKFNKNLKSRNIYPDKLPSFVDKKKKRNNKIWIAFLPHYAVIGKKMLSQVLTILSKVFLKNKLSKLKFGTSILELGFVFFLPDPFDSLFDSFLKRGNRGFHGLAETGPNLFKRVLNSIFFIHSFLHRRERWSERRCCLRHSD